MLPIGVAIAEGHDTDFHEVSVGFQDGIEQSHDAAKEEVIDSLEQNQVEFQTSQLFCRQHHVQTEPVEGNYQESDYRLKQSRKATRRSVILKKILKRKIGGNIRTKQRIPACRLKTRCKWKVKFVGTLCAKFLTRL